MVERAGEPNERPMRPARQPWAKRLALGAAAIGAVGGLVALSTSKPERPRVRLDSAFTRPLAPASKDSYRFAPVFGAAGDAFGKSVNVTTLGFEHHIRWDPDLVPSGAVVNVVVGESDFSNAQYVPFAPDQPSVSTRHPRYAAGMIAHNSEKGKDGPHVTVFTTLASDVPVHVALVRNDGPRAYTVHPVFARNLQAQFHTAQILASRSYRVVADARLDLDDAATHERVARFITEFDSLAPLMGSSVPTDVHVSLPLAFRERVASHGSFSTLENGAHLFSFQLAPTAQPYERTLAFHEGSHGVYDAQPGALARAAFDYFATRTLPDTLQTLSANEVDAVRNAFFNLHHERHYLPGLTPGEEVGHPKQNEKELFASTGAVLHHFPTEWLARVKAAENQPVLHALAVENAYRVIALYGPHPQTFFDPALLSYEREHAATLGLK